MRWILLVLLLMTVFVPVQVYAQLPLPFDEIVDGRLTLEHDNQRYSFTGQSGQNVVIGIVSSSSIVYASLYDGANNHLAYTTPVANDPVEQRELVSYTLSSSGSYELVIAASYQWAVDKSPVDYQVGLSTYTLQNPSDDACPSDLQVGQSARIIDPSRIQPYVGDPYITRYLGTFSATHPYGMWGLHVSEQPIMFDATQPVFLAEGPACLNGQALWRVRAHGLDGQPVHFWMDEQREGQPVLIEPQSHEPQPYLPPVTVLEKSAPLVGLSKQVAFFGGGGSVGEICFQPSLDNSSVGFTEWFVVSTYFPPQTPVEITIYNPDGDVFERYDNLVPENNCTPLQPVSVNFRLPWYEKFGVWIVELVTPMTRRRIAFETFPTTTVVQAMLVCPGMQPYHLLTGAQPNGTFDLVRVTDEDDDSQLEYYDLVERQRWHIPADASGNALIRPSYQPDVNEMWILETPQYNWQAILDVAATGEDAGVLMSLWEIVDFKSRHLAGGWSSCRLPDNPIEARLNAGEYGGEMSGMLWRDYTINYYTFRCTAGQVVDISATGVEAGDVDLKLELLGPDGSSLISNDDAVNSLYSFFDPRIENFTLPADGLYTIVISAAFGYGAFTLVMQ